MNIVSLQTPVGEVQIRCRTVFRYRCSEGHEIRVYASAFRGKTAVPGVGAITCPQCELAEKTA